MSVQYEILKKLVKLSGMKTRGTMSAAEIVALKKKENAKNRIPAIHDEEIETVHFSFREGDYKWQ